MREMEMENCVNGAVMDLLLHKMEMHDGFSHEVLKWVQEFLSNGRQRMLLQGCASDFHAVTSRVPHGSVLGSALFLVYINNILVGLKFQAFC